MSLHALAINHVLALHTNPNEISQQQQQSRFRYNKNTKGYGSIRKGTINETQPIMDSMGESNIWGVPATDISRAHMLTSSIDSSSMLLGHSRPIEEAEMKPINLTKQNNESKITGTTSTTLSITAPPPPPLQPFYVDEEMRKEKK